MRRTATAFLGVLFLTCAVTAAHATIYPPGPGGSCPDTLDISEIQSSLFGTPVSACVPAIGDSVRGVKGIIIGNDPHATGFAIYFQEAGSNAPWTGIDIFTGGTNRFASQGLALGDEIAVYGSINSFSNEDQIVADDGSFGNNQIVRLVSTGNPLPPFKDLTVAEASRDNFPAGLIPNAEQWEGMLVRVNTTMRVVRNTNMGFRLFLMVDDAICPDGSAGPCDSLLVDGNTLSNPRFDAPDLGTFVSSVQGVFNERTGNPSDTGYRIQLRDGNDIVSATPPNLTDAFSISNDSVRVVYDREVTAASAEDVFNYSLASFGTIFDADLVEPNVVHLHISNGLAVGDNEGVSVNNIVSTSSGIAMTTQQASAFFNGVLDITDIQAPDPDSLVGASIGCIDRSRMAGAGTGFGQRMTMRAIVFGQYGNSYYMNDATTSSGKRLGMQIFAPIVPLAVGNEYLIAGSIQEFFNETEAVGNVYLRDLGPAVIPSPEVIDLSVLLDTSCDATQSTTEAEDYEGQFGRIEDVHIVQTVNPGQGFFVAESAPNFTGSFNVRDRSNSITVFAAQQGHRVNVQGAIGQFSPNFDIDPRSDADIEDLGGPSVDVPTSAPQLRFSVFPNPARQANVALGLPKASKVDLGVYDLLGRRLVTLASGELGAGEHSFSWNGRVDGKRTASGVYFYKLRVGDEVRTLRSVLID